MKYLWVYLTLFVLLNICFSYQLKQIDFDVNPGCIKECKEPWLIYGKRGDVNSSLHYLWSAQEIPTFVLALTEPNVELNINWDGYQKHQEGSLYFTSVPRNTFAFQIQNLILFNDRNDTGKFDNGTSVKDKKTFPLSDFRWEMMEESLGENSTSYFSAVFKAVSYKGAKLSNRTTFSLQMSAFSDAGSSFGIPHLKASAKNMIVGVVLDRLSDSLKNEFENPRWALDVVFLSSDNQQEENKFTCTDTWSLSDEEAPGVFDVISISSPSAGEAVARKGPQGGYLQWRPVAYLTQDKNVAQSTRPNFDQSLPPMDYGHAARARPSLLRALFGDNLGNALSAQTPVWFGYPGDGFYKKYNYTVWSFAVGLGAPPQEKFSLSTILFIGLGLGMPTVAILAVVVYFVRKRRSDPPLLGEN